MIRELKKYNMGTLQKFRTPVDIHEAIDHISKKIHIWFYSDSFNDARIVKVNGRIKTFKRNPKAFDVPVKYGLHQYFHITHLDLNDILIPIEKES